jgi:hypothetical protein
MSGAPNLDVELVSPGEFLIKLSANGAVDTLELSLVGV